MMIKASAITWAAAHDSVWRPNWTSDPHALPKTAGGKPPKTPDKYFRSLREKPGMWFDVSAAFFAANELAKDILTSRPQHRKHGNY